MSPLFPHLSSQSVFQNFTNCLCVVLYHSHQGRLRKLSSREMNVLWPFTFTVAHKATEVQTDLVSDVVYDHMNAAQLINSGNILLSRIYVSCIGQMHNPTICYTATCVFQCCSAGFRFFNTFCLRYKIQSWTTPVIIFVYWLRIIGFIHISYSKMGAGGVCVFCKQLQKIPI